MFNRHWGNDRRRFQRLNLDLVVWYQVLTPDYLRQKLGSRENEAITIDISPLGMAFTCIHQIPAYAELALKFIVFSAHAGSYSHLAIPLEVKAQVRSCIVSENKEYRIGVCFSQIETEKRVALARLMQESLRPII